MIKTLTFILSFLMVNLLIGQSFLKTSINGYGFVGESVDKNIKLGLTIGHQKHFAVVDIFRIVLGESIDFKRSHFSHYSGGLGGGTSTSGTINFINFRLDTRARFGNEIFADFGLFTSYALIKKMTNTKAITSFMCYIPGQGQPICNPPMEVEPIDQFSRFDYGPLIAIGYAYKKIFITLDAQMGLINVVNLKYSKFKTKQFNLSLEIPFSLLKVKKDE